MPMKFRNGSSWVEVLARRLSPGDRETVLGDLAEAGETGRRALWSVAGLLMWRQLSTCRNWRPWIAALGLAMPASLLLMGFSVSIAQTYQSINVGTVLQATGLNVGPPVVGLLCDLALLSAWSATAGFAVRTISRRTTWISITFSLLACMFCLARFRMDHLSRFCLLLFLPPALAGFCLALRISRIPFGAFLAIAIVTTALTTLHWNKSDASLFNWVLTWPAWYLVANAWNRPPHEGGLPGKYNCPVGRS